jgi:hypothetical protein
MMNAGIDRYEVFRATHRKASKELLQIGDWRDTGDLPPIAHVTIQLLQFEHALATPRIEIVNIVGLTFSAHGATEKVSRHPKDGQ